MSPEEACQTKKFFFWTEHNAQIVADWHNEFSPWLEPEKKLHPYKCPVPGCGGYHLTSTEQRESSRREHHGGHETH